VTLANVWNTAASILGCNTLSRIRRVVAESSMSPGRRVGNRNRVVNASLEEYRTQEGRAKRRVVPPHAAGRRRIGRIPARNPETTA
jgi:hypothetical protein